MHGIEIRRIEGENGVDTVEVSGSLDAHNFEQLEELFDACFDQGCYSLVIDISRLEYVSSAGVGVFIGAAGRAQANEGNVVVVAPREAVQEIFDLLGVTHIFPVVATRENALAYSTPVTG